MELCILWSADARPGLFLSRKKIPNSSSFEDAIFLIRHIYDYEQVHFTKYDSANKDKSWSYIPM